MSLRKLDMWGRRDDEKSGIFIYLLVNIQLYFGGEGESVVFFCLFFARKEEAKIHVTVVSFHFLYEFTEMTCYTHSACVKTPI